MVSNINNNILIMSCINNSWIPQLINNKPNNYHQKYIWISQSVTIAY